MREPKNRRLAWRRNGKTYELWRGGLNFANVASVKNGLWFAYAGQDCPQSFNTGPKFSTSAAARAEARRIVVEVLTQA
jgi:hypothetical protein